jgi:hypothetical protein
MQNGLEHELLELDDLGSDAIVSFPLSVRVKIRVARGSNSDTYPRAFHDSIEHSPQSSRVVPSGHEHYGSELMLVAPWRKHLAFTFGSNVGSGNCMISVTPSHLSWRFLRGLPLRALQRRRNQAIRR